jgi:hypothetical protein
MTRDERFGVRVSAGSMASTAAASRPRRSHRGALRAAVVIVVAAVLLGAAVTGAPGKAAKNSTGAAWASIVTQEGQSLVLAGYFKDSVLGSGAVTFRLQVAAAQEPATVNVTAREVTLYTRKGSLRGSATATTTSNPDGSSTTTNGKLKLTKGTGAYKGHRFTATFTGSSAADTNVISFEVKGVYR